MMCQQSLAILVRKHFAGAWIHVKILVVEDDPILGKSIAMLLEYEGYEVFWVQSLKAAFETESTQTLDLAILDLGLPDGHGGSFCKKLRQGGSRLPIVMLTAQTTEDSVVNGLDIGADDYVKKPFGNRELLARVRNLLRRPQSHGEQIQYGDLTILKEKRRVLNGEAELVMSRREYDILLYLAERADTIVTREQLVLSVDREGDMNDRAVDSHISHIRSKFKKSSVTSVKITPIYGIGYMMEKA